MYNNNFFYRGGNSIVVVLGVIQFICTQKKPSFEVVVIVSGRYSELDSRGLISSGVISRRLFFFFFFFLLGCRRISDLEDATF